MGLFSRLRRRTTTDEPARASDGTGSRRATVAHLTSFVREKVGVEAYVEPPVTDTPPSILLVATTGEWTRRAAPDERSAWKVAESLGVPVYNVQFTGYPQRYRDWNSRARGRRLTTDD
ncbi:oxidoreductase [Sanguibacter hominis ATCC BAA-789]|uniref:Oxidoreductase n=1 Tax=Sanguibacter hominis ATCC BAA-789 TaxID=1312740 RepID=A0A9X5FE08_9MICO|nr:oxidoreductase [Sanguibacter hominis]NKX93157.1 oxidoreductase [Sanguibacter hominis ATCC BAA-789]